MSASLLISLATRNLRRGGRRNLFLALAIAISAGSMILVLASFADMQTRIVQSGTALLSGHINIQGFERLSSGYIIHSIADARRIRESLAGAHSEIEDITLRHVAMVRISSDAESFRRWLVGVSIDNESRLQQDLRESFSQRSSDAEIERAIEGLRTPGSVILFDKAAERLEVTVGDRVTVSTRTPLGANNAIDLKVVAILPSMGHLTSTVLFADFDSLGTLLRRRPESATTLLVYLRDRELAHEVLAAVRRALAEGESELMPYLQKSLNRTGRLAKRYTVQGPNLATNTWEDQLDFLIWRARLAQWLALVLIGTLAIVVGIGLANSMIISTMQRTKEIGALRAMGLSRLKVVLLFMLESAVLGGAGAFAGAVLGLAVAAGLDAAAIPIESSAFRAVYFSSTLRLTATPFMAAQIAIAFSAVAVLASVGPALRAARIPPAAAARG